MHKSSFNNFLSDGKNGFSEAEGITVLSLFDGMSCGQLALQKLGIKVKQYYAAEIDKHAIQVTQHNFPNTIQLGDVTKVFAKDLPKIDLLIGGSPCQGFSFAGKQLAFNDPRSKLFFEFVRLKNECNPTYFMLENVKMKKEFEIIISKYMGVAPIEINSALLSAQNRVRLYWTNIANEAYGLFGDMQCMIPQPKDKRVLLQDVLENDVPGKFYLTDKALARIEKDATIGIKAKIDPDKSGTITIKNQSGQLAIDNSTTLIESLKGCLKFGRTDEAKQLRKESMAKGKDHTPFQKKQINEIDFEKMNTLTTAITKDNIICEIMGNKANTLTPDAYLATGERNRDENGKAVLTSMCDRRLRRLTPTECERLQTVPDGYTSIVSDTQRYRMLGNGWTVDVIAHIFSFMTLQKPQLHKHIVMPSCLRMSLKTKWFEMTKAGIKTEDYREINDYWAKRLLTKPLDSCGGMLHGLEVKKFDYNIMTLGYPKSTDSERILKLEHKGIEIRTGNPEWGAEPNKLYFVITHGAILA